MWNLSVLRLSDHDLCAELASLLCEYKRILNGLLAVNCLVTIQD